ncbi:MAG: Uma2 family endonuclease [Desulfobacteraceae bacterium]|nr:Uma2 family endonuclease [Desulfobacteraceae bacterium]
MTTYQMLERDYDDPVHIGWQEEVSEDGLYVSEEEYWEKYYDHPDFNYEWNNGYLEEKPVTDHKGSELYHWFLLLLHQFLGEFPIAKMIGLEFGFRLKLPRKRKTVRKPDLSVVRNDNPIILHPDDQSYGGTFDMCIESLSYSKPSEIRRDTVEKKKEYENVRVREYFILDARGKKTAFYRLDGKGKYREISPADGDVVCSEVLPGFRFRISDIYCQPPLEEMADDNLYSGFVLPFHQKVKQKAELAEKKAEQERQRAEQIGLQLIAERQRAAMLADKLRQLGISVE